MHRAVILDLGGVIAPGPTQAQIEEAAAACGVPPADFLRAFWKDRLAYDAGRDPEEYWHGVADLLGRKFDSSLIAAMIEREIQFWLRFDDRMLAWARQQRAAGTPVGLLSNLPSPLGNRLRNDAFFMSHFDHTTMSFELGMVKPQREIYEHAVRGLSVEPADALFIDDKQENIEGAQAAGLQTALYRSWEDFRKESANV